MRLNLFSVSSVRMSRIIYICWMPKLPVLSLKLNDLGQTVMVLLQNLFIFLILISMLTFWELTSIFPHSVRSFWLHFLFCTSPSCSKKHTLYSTHFFLYGFWNNGSSFLSGLSARWWYITRLRFSLHFSTYRNIQIRWKKWILCLLDICTIRSLPNFAYWAGQRAHSEPRETFDRYRMFC